MVILGTTGLMITMSILFIFTAIALVLTWIFAASVADAFNKTEDEFPDRTLWIVILLGSIFVLLPWLTGLIYYFIFKPSLKFWK
jgi:uncharacterized BrkB/YihY/UPF0761 family membrane protein